MTPPDSTPGVIECPVCHGNGGRWCDKRGEWLDCAICDGADAIPKPLDDFQAPAATPAAPNPANPAQRPPAASEGATLRAEVEAELRHPVMASTGSGEVSADLLRRCLAALARAEGERDVAVAERDALRERLEGEAAQRRAEHEQRVAEARDWIRRGGRPAGRPFSLRAPGVGESPSQQASAGPGAER